MILENRVVCIKMGFYVKMFSVWRGDERNWTLYQ